MSKKKGAGSEVPVSQDDIATIMPAGRGPSNAAVDALVRQQGALGTVGLYIAATLDSEFRGPEVILEGECEGTVRIYDRRTGLEIGHGKVSVPITFTQEHRRDG